MKTIFLNEEQVNFIKNNGLQDGATALPSAIMRDLDENTILDEPDFSKKILLNRFNTVKEQFTDDIEAVPLIKVVDAYSKLQEKIRKREENIRPQLEQLCYDTLVSIFNIPEDELTINLNLVDQIDPGTEFHVSPDTNEDYEYDSIEAIDTEGSEVEKRRLINTLVYGAALTYYEDSRKEYMSEVFELDEELPHMYSKLMKIGDYLLFKCNVKITDRNTSQKGFVKIVLGTDDIMSRIEVKATCFPILLVEAIKGLMELVSSNGLPDDFDAARNVINKADVLEKEPWDMRYGPELWKMVTNGGKVKSNIAPDFFRKLIDIDTNSFNSLIHELSKKTRVGRQAIEELIDDCTYAAEYSDFEKGLLQKNSGKGIVLDEYFTEEELAEDI